MRQPWKLAVTGDGAHADGSTIHGDIGLDELAEHNIEWSLIAGHGGPIRAEELDGYDAVLLMGSLAVGDEQLAGARSLAHVARFGAGFDQVDVDACSARGITVTNAPNGLRTPMAHTSLTLLFALAHQLLPKDRLVRTGEWGRKAEYRGKGLGEATIGMIGLGGIGQETVRQLRALGLNVVAWNRSPRPEFCADAGIEQLPLDDVLVSSDYLIVTVAASPGTVNLIGDRELRLMKESAFLINVARGSIVDEEALVGALSEGRIAGAGLDVFEEEPLPVSSSLIEMENVVLAPHALCWTEDFTNRTAAEVRREIIAVSEGRAPLNAVNAPIAVGRDAP